MVKKDQITKRNIQHPLFGISMRKWIRLIQLNDGIDRPYLARALFITICSLLTSPARLIFKIKYLPRIKAYTIHQPPVIIIGHWRSGTTFLHELLSQDQRFCYVSLWNTLLPDTFPLFEPIKRFLRPFLPKTRPMDNIEVEIDGPYEEEAGIAVLSPWSFFHCLHFPRNAEEQYLRSIHFKDMTTREKQQWAQQYLTFMKTVVLMNEGKRLLLKDPANTARITFLLELFPNAKFIHIYRNPYTVYYSTIRMRKKVLEKLALQDANSDDIKTQVIQNYQRLMTAFFEQKKSIPPENYVEIRYEDLVATPLEQIETIYRTLNIPGFKETSRRMTEYLKQKSEYKTNTYSFDQQTLTTVKNNWSFTIDMWNYDLP